MQLRQTDVSGAPPPLFMYPPATACQEAPEFWGSPRARELPVHFRSVSESPLESPTEAANCRITRDPGTLPRCAADRMLPAIYTSSGHVLVTSSLQRPSK